MKDIYIQAIGLVAGILTASSILPQLVKTIRSKQAEDISSFVFVILIAEPVCGRFTDCCLMIFRL